MKRRIFSMLVCLCLSFCIVFSVSASSGLPMVIDSAGLMDSEEQAALEDAAQELRVQLEMDVVILTVSSLGGRSAQNLADSYYDENGYGYGERYSGILFLLAMEEREWYISTCGDAIYVFTDHGIERIGEAVVPYLSEGRYYDGFSKFLSMLPDYVDAYDDQSPIDGYAESYGPRDQVVYYQPPRQVNHLVSLLIGVVVAAVVVLIMRASMNTKRRQHSAGNYLKPGSYHLRTRQDIFLYSNVSKVRRQQNNGGGHGGGHGGGSSVHRSSGGRSHGGRGGRF